MTADLKGPKRASWIKILYALALLFMCVFSAWCDGSRVSDMIAMVFAPTLFFAFGADFASRPENEEPLSWRSFLQRTKESFFKYLLPVLCVASFPQIVRMASEYDTYSPIDCLKLYFESILWGYGPGNAGHDSIGALWIPFSLFWITIVFYPIRKLVGKHFALPVILLFSAAGYVLTSKGIGLPFALNGTLMQILFFAAGAFFFEHIEFFKKYIFVGIGLTVISIPAFILLSHKGFNFFSESGNYVTPLSFVTALSAVIIVTALSVAVSRFTGPVGRVISYAGCFPVSFLCIRVMAPYMGNFWGPFQIWQAESLFRFVMLTVSSLLVGCIFKRILPISEGSEEDVTSISQLGIKSKKVTGIILYVMFGLIYLYSFFATTLIRMLVRDLTLLNTLYDMAAIVVGFLALWNILLIEKKSHRVLALLAILPGIVLWARGGTFEIFVITVLIIAMINREFRPILIISVIIGSFMMILAYQLSMHGYIPYLVYNTGGEYGSHAFGIIYRTDFGAHVLYLTMAYAALRKEKITTLGFMVLVFGTWFTWRYVHPRINTFCLVLFLAVYGIYILLALFGKKLKIPKWLCVSHVVCSAIAVIATLVLGNGTANVAGVNLGSLSDRLIMSKQAFDEYGFHLFGRPIFERGVGAIVDESIPHFFLDISYIRNIEIHGLIIAVLYLVIMTVASYRAAKGGHTIMAMSFIIVAIVSLIEHHATEIAYNVFILAAFANMGWTEGSPKWITKFKQLFSRKKKDT